MAVNHQDYYYGSKKAHLPVNKITAYNMQTNKEQVYNVMNGAFKLYHDGHQAASRISDVLHTRHYSASSRKIVLDMQSDMKADLRHTANSSTFFADLLTCFRHLESTNGVWSDTKHQGWRGFCNVPEGVSSFLESVAEKQNEVAKSAAEWKQNVDTMKRLKEEKAWEKLPDQLEKTSKVIEYVAPKLWVGIGIAGENAEAYTGRMVQVFGWAGQVYNALDLGLKIRYSSSMKQTAFVEAMAFVVQGLPIFGTLYADLIRGVPAMVDYFKRVRMERYGAVGL